MVQVKKPRKKITNRKTTPKQIVEDNLMVIDYSSFSSSKFVEFIEEIWNEQFHDSGNKNFNIKYKFSNLISEIRFHIKQKQELTQNLAQKFGSYDQNSDNWIIPPEVQHKFQNELNTLNNTKIQSENTKMSVSELKEAGMWQHHPFSKISMSIIEMLDDILYYDLFEEETTNQS